VAASLEAGGLAVDWWPAVAAAAPVALVLAFILAAEPLDELRLAADEDVPVPLDKLPSDLRFAGDTAPPPPPSPPVSGIWLLLLLLNPVELPTPLTTATADEYAAAAAERAVKLASVKFAYDFWLPLICFLNLARLLLNQTC